MYCATPDGAIDPGLEGSIDVKNLVEPYAHNSQQSARALGDNVEVRELADALAQASALSA